ncbi:MAG: hypothetical protein ACKOBM_17580 [Gammaproteobacteria bacterium]
MDENRNAAWLSRLAVRARQQTKWRYGGQFGIGMVRVEWQSMRSQLLGQSVDIGIEI